MSDKAPAEPPETMTADEVRALPFDVLWIKSSARVPEFVENQPIWVLCYTGAGSMTVGFWAGNQWVLDNGDDEVVYWSRMPAKP